MQVYGSNPFGKATVVFAENHGQKTGSCIRFPHQKPKSSPWTRILNDIYISYTFLQLQAECVGVECFHLCFLTAILCEVWDFGMLGREFGSILPGVITSIKNPNNNYTIVCVGTTENYYIRIV